MKYIFFIFSVYVLFYFFYRNSTLVAIDDIRTNFKFFPKHYCLPPRMIRKHFGLKKSEIPKFLCFRLYVSLSSWVLAPISSIICVCVAFDKTVIYIMMSIPPIFVVADTITFLIMLHIYKKR